MWQPWWFSTTHTHQQHPPTFTQSLYYSTCRHLKLLIIRCIAAIPLPRTQRNALGLPLHAHIATASSQVIAKSPYLKVLLGGLVLMFVIWNACSSCVLFPSIYFTLFPFPKSASNVAWMDPREIALITDTLHDNMTMLEYGSGISTLHFSKLVNRYVSVEHNIGWCNMLINMAKQQEPLGLQRIRIEKVERNHEDYFGTVLYDSLDSSLSQIEATYEKTLEIYCIAQNAPRDEELSSWNYKSWFCCFRRCPSTESQFYDYIHVLDYIDEKHRKEEKFPITYDVALIDGRARPQTAYYSIPYLTQPTSFSHPTVFVHDWNKRYAYHDLLKWFKLVKAQYESEQPGGGGK